MMEMEESEPVKKYAHEIGCNLDNLSVDELEKCISLMRNEIERLNVAIIYKKSSRSDAEEVFKK